MAAAMPVVSPGAVLKAMEDPSVFPETARGDLYVGMGVMREMMKNPNFPTAMRLDYLKFLARMGRVDQPEQQVNPNANLPMIQIILPNSGKNTTIDARPVQTIDVTPETQATSSEP